MYTGLHVKCCYSDRMLIRLEFSWRNFAKNFQYDISWKSIDWEPNFYMQTDWQTDGQTDGLTDRRGDGRTDSYYEVNSLLSKCRHRSYKQGRNWAARVKTEKLGSEGWTPVTRTPVPENLSSLVPCYVHLQIYICNCDRLSTWFAWSLNMLSICWTETSLTKFQLSLFGITRQRRRKLHFGGSLKSRWGETLC
jgi:hypothetical protein